MAEVSAQAQRQRERPRFYNMDRIREELEDFTQFQEQTSMEINQNKGYFRELLKNDDYAFGVYMSMRLLERERPKVKYYYEVLKGRNCTKEEALDMVGGADYYWMYNVPFSEVLSAGNIEKGKPYTDIVLLEGRRHYTQVFK